MALIQCFAAVVILFALLSFLHLFVIVSIPWSEQQTDANHLCPSRLLVSFFCSAFICIRAKRRKKLTIGGSILAFVMGVSITLCSYTYMAMLLTFFFTSTRLTAYKKERKAVRLNEVVERDWQQVMANGGIPLFVTFLIIIDSTVSSNERPINFNLDFSAAFYDLAVLGALACSTGDTWASEIGAVTGFSDPILITSWKMVPRGTNGGVSLIGFLSSGCGGFVIGLTHWLCIWLFSNNYLIKTCYNQWLLIVIGTFFGLFGSLVDSVLGATCQYSGYDLKKNVVVSTPGPGIRHISGCDWINNNSVNLISVIICSIACPAVGLRCWGYIQ